MKIIRAIIYTVDLPTKGGGYRRTSGFSPDSNVSTIVQLDTDEGISGRVSSLVQLIGSV